MNISFHDENKPVFYIVAQDGKPAFAYIGETTDTDNPDFPETDTLHVNCKLYKNNVYKELLHVEKDTFFSDNYRDTDLLFNNGIKYASNEILENSNEYTFTLKYKNYSEITVSSSIPEATNIDTLFILPNVASSHEGYFIQHQITLNFVASANTHVHYYSNVFIKYTDTLVTQNSYGFSGKDIIFKDADIERGTENSMTFTFSSVAENGNFIPYVYLFSISDSYYASLIKKTAHEEYTENSGFFDPKPLYIPYSMVPDAFVNIYAFSFSIDSCNIVNITP